MLFVDPELPTQVLNPNKGERTTMEEDVFVWYRQNVALRIAKQYDEDSHCQPTFPSWPSIFDRLFRCFQGFTAKSSPLWNPESGWFDDRRLSLTERDGSTPPPRFTNVTETLHGFCWTVWEQHPAYCHDLWPPLVVYSPIVRATKILYCFRRVVNSIFVYSIKINTFYISSVHDWYITVN